MSDPPVIGMHVRRFRMAGLVGKSLLRRRRSLSLLSRASLHGSRTNGRDPATSHVTAPVLPLCERAKGKCREQCQPQKDLFHLNSISILYSTRSVVSGRCWRITKTAQTVEPALSKSDIGRGPSRPSQLYGKRAGGLHHGQEAPTPPKAEYIGADHMSRFSLAIPRRTIHTDIAH